jgi:hypothetical protein
MPQVNYKYLSVSEGVYPVAPESIPEYAERDKE